ncbi:MAG: peptidase U32 family protein [Pseudomonadota bacterium]
MRVVETQRGQGWAPEVLAPGGSPEAIAAALTHGADAVYVGVGALNARVRAANLDPEGLRRVTVATHARGARVHVALNVPVSPRTLPAALETLAWAWLAGADAVILRDPLLMHVCREVLPELPVHASTQAAAAGPGRAQALMELGCRRVILARECSLAEIRRIRDACPGLELEAFVLGALCFGISGHCLLGEAVGGRSGNHGACLQACRLPFMDGKGRPLGHLMSMKDLDAVRRIPELVDAGVVSLKIEGRLKAPSWVGCASAWVSRAAAAWRRGPLGAEDYARFDQELCTLFSRPRTDAWLDGIQDAAHLTFPRDPGHRGLEVPFRLRAHEGETWLSLQAPVALSLRDGLLVRRARRDGVPREEAVSIRALRDGRGRHAGVVEAGREALVSVDAPGQVVGLAIHSCQAVEARYRPDAELAATLLRPGPPAPEVVSLVLEPGSLALILASGRFRHSLRSAVETAPARGEDFGPVQAARLFPVAVVEAAPGLYVPPAQLKARRREARAGFEEAMQAAEVVLVERLTAAAAVVAARWFEDDATLLARGPAAVSRVTGLPTGRVTTTGGDRFRLRPAPRGTVVDVD